MSSYHLHTSLITVAVAGAPTRILNFEIQNPAKTETARSRPTEPRKEEGERDSRDLRPGNERRELERWKGKEMGQI